MGPGRRADPAFRHQVNLRRHQARGHRGCHTLNQAFETVRFWLDSPQHDEISTLVGLNQLVTRVRHLPDCGLRTVPSLRTSQLWLPPPWHGYTCTRVPLDVGPPRTSRQVFVPAILTAPAAPPAPPAATSHP